MDREAIFNGIFDMDTGPAQAENFTAAKDSVCLPGNTASIAEDDYDQHGETFPNDNDGDTDGIHIAPDSIHGIMDSIRKGCRRVSRITYLIGSYIFAIVSGILQAAFIACGISAVACIVMALWLVKTVYLPMDMQAQELVMGSVSSDFIYTASSYIYDSKGKQIAKLKADNESAYLKYEDIPENVINAFVAVEDRNFWTNPGYDIKGIARVAYEYARTKGGERHGASTITQQLVRGTYLTREVSINRKIRELLAARWMAKRYTKKDIMEFYVNDVCFANQYYGIEAAAKGYFNKRSKDLTLSQTAYLCAIPNSPSYYDPYNDPSRAVKRRDKILKDMYGEGYITYGEYTQATGEKITVEPKKVQQGGLNDYQTTYAEYCAVRFLMEKDGFAFRYTFDDSDDYAAYRYDYQTAYDMKRQQLKGGGYRIYTTLDSALQDRIQEDLDAGLSFNDEVDISSGIYALQGAVAVIDNESGKVIALSGGRTGGTGDVYTLNRACQSFRQPGSSIKPLAVYTPAIESGYTPDTVVTNIDVAYAKEHKDLKPTDMGGQKMPLRTAVEKSLNGVAWRTLYDTGVENGVGRLAQMHYRKVIPADYTLATALGGMTNGVTAVEQASGYCTLANHGMFRDPTCIRSVKDRDGKEIYVSPLSTRVYEKEAADTMIDILTGVLTNGTAKRINWYSSTSVNAAGKTGTTNNSKDGWFCGVTPDYSVAVWVGFDQPRELDSLQGATYPAEIWKECMLDTLSVNGIKHNTFDIPDTRDYSAAPEEGPEEEERSVPAAPRQEQAVNPDTAYASSARTCIAMVSTSADAGSAAAWYSQGAQYIASVQDAGIKNALTAELNTAYALTASRLAQVQAQPQPQ